MGRQKLPSKKKELFPRGPILTSLEKELARRDLAAYAAIIHPRFRLYRHTKVVFDFLQQVEDGKIDRLAIAQPPRHGKSLGACQLLPAHMLGQRPHLQVICITFGKTLTRRFGRYVRNALLNPKHQEIFPDCKLSNDMMAIDEFATTAQGFYTAVGRGGGIVGKGANLMILDDIIKSRSELRSEAVMDSIFDNFGAIYSRLERTHDGFDPAIVINAHRWGERDVTGYVLSEYKYDNWKYVSLPAICEKLGPGEERPSYEWRQPGEALWPEMFDRAYLDRQREREPLDWDTLYQQNVKSRGGREFQLKWLDETPRHRMMHHKELTRYIFVDPSGEARYKRSDYTAMWVIGLGVDKNIYILDLVRDRLGITERVNTLFKLWERWRPIRAVYYEQYSVQSDIRYLLEQMEQRNRRFSLVQVGGTKISKEDRIRMLIPWFENHRIIFPVTLNGTTDGQEVDLLRAFRHEYQSFPNGQHDDMLDALSRIEDPKVSLDWPLSNEELNRRALWEEWEDGDGKASWMSA